jgi:hypothetical protein
MTSWCGRTYIFGLRHTNANAYIDDFKEVKKSLVEKYGRPKHGDDDACWKDELYKDDPDIWGMAISAGHLVYQAAWQTDRTDILLMLKGDNFEVRLIAQYTSKELGHLEDEKQSSQNPF